MGNFGISELVHNGEIYDQVNQSDFDIPFFQKWSQKVSGEVLELCCGTGRITIPLAQSGVHITGLDISESMLANARKKRDELGLTFPIHQGDIRNFQLNKKFDLIFIPFNSLQCIYTTDELESVFQSVKNHLAPKGLFIIDIFNPSIDLMVERKDSWKLMREFKMNDGRIVRIEEKCKYDPAGQVNRVSWKHTIDGVESIEQLDMRCFYPLEMDAILKYNGFQVLHKFGNFDEGQFQSNSTKQIYVCQTHQ